MKPSAILVNTARGDVIDEPALIGMLEAGRIAGAGLDVYAEEPRVPGALGMDLRGAPGGVVMGAGVAGSGGLGRTPMSGMRPHVDAVNVTPTV